jgi:hypothetical protein
MSDKMARLSLALDDASLEFVARRKTTNRNWQLRRQ